VSVLRKTLCGKTKLIIHNVHEHKTWKSASDSPKNICVGFAKTQRNLRPFSEQSANVLPCLRAKSANSVSVLRTTSELCARFAKAQQIACPLCRQAQIIMFPFRARTTTDASILRNGMALCVHFAKHQQIMCPVWRKGSKQKTQHSSLCVRCEKQRTNYVPA